MQGALRMRRYKSLHVSILLRSLSDLARVHPTDHALISPVGDASCASPSALGTSEHTTPPIPGGSLHSAHSFSNHGFPNAHAVEPKHFSAHSDCDGGNSDNDDVSDEDGGVSDGETDFGNAKIPNETLAREVKAIVDILRETSSNRMQTKIELDKCGVSVSSELVVEVLSQVRNDWESAFTFFLWAGKQQRYSHSLSEYHSMISILAKMRKFDTAWTLIDEMRSGGRDRDHLCLVTSRTLLIMIRRYCAIHDVSRAINTFYAHKKYKLDVGMEEFQGLLSALCRYKNVQDAEHLLFCNRSVFPLNAKSMNIILNGWCNVIGSPRQGERIWKEMSKRGIVHDVVSYASLISCYSKSRNLNKVLKLFNRMKELEIAPDRKVYNAVIHALAKGILIKEARNCMKTMVDKGIKPNAVTYNSLTMPLCKARKVDDAKEVFDEMLEQGIQPTIRTYNAFLRILRTGEEVFDLLEKMKTQGCHPNYDTYIMLIRKFCRWCQLDNVFRLWNAMTDNGMSPDRSSYIVLIHGLFLNGKLEEAYRYYLEMKDKHFLPEPKIDEMFQPWVSGKELLQFQIGQRSLAHSHSDEAPSEKANYESDYLRQPEMKRVHRERGFSFWE